MRIMGGTEVREEGEAAQQEGGSGVDTGEAEGGAVTKATRMKTVTVLVNWGTSQTGVTTIKEPMQSSWEEGMNHPLLSNTPKLCNTGWVEVTDPTTPAEVKEARCRGSGISGYL